MKKKNRILIYSLIIMGFLLMLTYSCKKDDKKDDTTPTPNNGIIFNPNLTYGTITDIDGNVYKTITIGSKGMKTTQTWMAENLKVTHYRNGVQIPNVTDGSSWNNLNTGAFCWYNNDAAANANIYGALYNWYAVNDSRNIAPTGWHVASNAEWSTLVNFLGGQSIAGGKLKETGTTHWQNPNTGADNSSGFTALPGGYRYFNGTFYTIGYTGYWWNSTEYIPSDAWYWEMFSVNIGLNNLSFNKGVGLSVRCIMD
jgi:uncharacterized protein (TIGR02145 family)